MKKTILAIALGAATIAASAQAVEQPKFFDNWSIGINGGVTTPIKNAAFFGDMRGIAGLHIGKQLTPVTRVGVESFFGVNTSDWRGMTHSKTVFDNSYVGAYGAVDLFNLLGGYPCKTRPFSIEAQAGAGWGHYYLDKAAGDDHNFFATKAGLNFNFNCSPSFRISLSPSVMWNMTDGSWHQTSAAYDRRKATFQMEAGITYTMGGAKFECVQPYNQAQIDALNAQINSLRGQLEDANKAQALRAAEWQSEMASLEEQLTNARNTKPQVVTEVKVKDQYNSVRFVFFRIGSSTITTDQQPNVEMIANYMKNHPQSKVVIKGYASKDGNLDFNIKLAQNRAESVKDMLVKKYGISASRITAQGEGIGDMFEEESWNRVSICTLETE